MRDLDLARKFCDDCCCAALTKANKKDEQEKVYIAPVNQPPKPLTFWEKVSMTKEVFYVMGIVGLLMLSGCDLLAPKEPCLEISAEGFKVAEPNADCTKATVNKDGVTIEKE